MITNLLQAVWVEALKARRSKMPWLTALATALFPLAGGFFMIVVKDPEMAQRIGLISAKAHLLIAKADWPSYLDFLSLANAVGGIILYGFITSWVFGREYTDRTIKDLLALPTPRETIVLAKFLVIAGWSFGLAIVMVLSGFSIGMVIDLPPSTTQIMLHGMLTLSFTALLSLFLVTPIAFFASAGHGYLPPIAIMMLTVVMAQLVAVAGWGEYFPWAIPGLYAQGVFLGITSYVILILTFLAGLAGTLLWWVRADQTH
jgi:ABC-2 type transport system permease protein